MRSGSSIMTRIGFISPCDRLLRYLVQLILPWRDCRTFQTRGMRQAQRQLRDLILELGTGARQWIPDAHALRDWIEQTANRPRDLIVHPIPPQCFAS